MAALSLALGAALLQTATVASIDVAASDGITFAEGSCMGILTQSCRQYGKDTCAQYVRWLRGPELPRGGNSERGGAADVFFQCRWDEHYPFRGRCEEFPIACHRESHLPQFVPPPPVEPVIGMQRKRAQLLQVQERHQEDERSDILHRTDETEDWKPKNLLLGWHDQSSDIPPHSDWLREHKNPPTREELSQMEDSEDSELQSNSDDVKADGTQLFFRNDETEDWKPKMKLGATAPNGVIWQDQSSDLPPDPDWLREQHNPASEELENALEGNLEEQQEEHTEFV